jgi:hypothetical protein
LDLFLCYFYNAHFDPAGFDELRRIGVPSVNFYCNGIYQFEFVAAIAAKADFSWHPERDARQSYLSIGANPIWVQMGADPHVYHPMIGLSRQPKACFVGQRYADRDRWLARLIEAHIPVDIYGVGWQIDGEEQPAPTREEPTYLGRRQISPGKFGSYMRVIAEELQRNGAYRTVQLVALQSAYRRETRRLAETLRSRAKGKADDLSSIFGAYEVCLNFSNVWKTGRPGSPLISHVRLRDFETPMCRTCYLTGHNDEITEFYEVGSEIDTYHDQTELIDKVHFYFKNPTAAEHLRERGYRRALRDHTWSRRFEELFAKIGMSAGDR